jgi:hypothetical protein
MDSYSLETGRNAENLRPVGEQINPQHYLRRQRSPAQIIPPQRSPAQIIPPQRSPAQIIIQLLCRKLRRSHPTGRHLVPFGGSSSETIGILASASGDGRTDGENIRDPTNRR